MVQLSVKEAMELLEETASCNKMIKYDVGDILQALREIEPLISGGNQVSSILNKIKSQLGVLLDNIEGAQEKIVAFGSEQFESYTNRARNLEEKYRALISKLDSMAASIDDMGSFVGTDFVTMNRQNIGTATVGFMKDSSGRSQKVVL